MENSKTKDKSVEQLELEVSIEKLMNETEVPVEKKLQDLNKMQLQLITMDNARYNQDIEFQLRDD